MPRNYPLLWVDSTISRNDPDAPHEFEDGFEIHRFTGLTSLDSEIERVKPAVICFEFDFPSKIGLKLLQKTKQSHTCTPILMMTVQHSESLAVWAFRSKVWDYLVKPVAKDEIRRTIISLHEMLQMQALQVEPRSIAAIRTLIPEENRAIGMQERTALKLADAIEFVERNFRDKISSSEVAQQCNLTPFQFSREFKNTYGLTFQEYVLRYRIREACRLLKNPAAEITEIASLTGFNDPSYFGKIFRRYLSCSPSEYKASSQVPLNSDLVENLPHLSAHPEF